MVPFQPRGTSKAINWVNLPASLKVTLLKSFREEAETCDGRWETCDGRWAASSRSVRGDELGGDGLCGQHPAGPALLPAWGTPATTSAAVSIHPPTGVHSGPHVLACRFLGFFWHVVFTVTGLESIGPKLHLQFGGNQLLCPWIQRRDIDHQFEDKSRGHHVMLCV